MKILRDRKARNLYLIQKWYIEKVLYMFNIQNAESISTTLAAHFRLCLLYFHNQMMRVIICHEFYILM